jgi:hypothetical protein
MKLFKNFFNNTTSTKSIHNEEVNKIHCGGLSVNEFIEEHKDLEMNEITIKPLRKIWNEVVTKLRYSKPKQRLNSFNYIKDELSEIYGEENGNTLMNILCDVFEGEFYKVNNGNFERVGFILHRSNEKKWVKTVNKVNSFLNNDNIQLQIS